MPSGTKDSKLVASAVQAVERGFQPIPIMASVKKPTLSGWTRIKWDPMDLDHVREKFKEWEAQGHTNLGLLLGEPSGGLIDIDLDDPRALRLKDYFLPPTAMKSGRAGRRGSHYWYRVNDLTEVPTTRRYKMPSDGVQGAVSVELRSTKAQTVIPPSVHPSGEDYIWEGAPWGGDEGPARVDSTRLMIRVATLGLAAVLVDNWPTKGSRHEAYLALAGGLLRQGNEKAKEFWRQALPMLIGPLTEATLDEDGAESRIHEVMSTTLSRLERDEEVVGFGTLAELIGHDHVHQVKRMVREVASLSGVGSEFSIYVDDASVADDGDPAELLETAKSDRKKPKTKKTTRSELPDSIEIIETDEDESDLPSDPLTDRVVTWEAVNLDPYLEGQVQTPEPEIFSRSDGKYLMYAGRVNMLVGSSESAKSWLAIHVCLEEIGKGERVLYIDFEDEPVNTLDRMRWLGAGTDDIRLNFSYIRPEEPLEDMQRNKWGSAQPTPIGRLNQTEFDNELATLDPTLIVADGMTSLYGLHGLDVNDASNTDIITTWLKRLTRNGRSTVLVIDHTNKSSERGSLPSGSQHKVSAVQGTLLQVWTIRQPQKGAIGQLDLIVLKDRLGSVRQIAQQEKRGKAQKAQHVATVILDSRVPGVANLTVGLPSNVKSDSMIAELERSREAARSEEHELWNDRVLTVFGGEDGKELMMKDIVGKLSYYDNARNKTRAATKRLVDKGWLERLGQTRNTRFKLVIGDAGYLSMDDDEPSTDQLSE